MSPDEKDEEVLELVVEEEGGMVGMVPPAMHSHPAVEEEDEDEDAEGEDESDKGEDVDGGLEWEAYEQEV